MTRDMMKVLIDNGHGVETKGKRSPDGLLREYKYCREIAGEVVRRLKSQGVDAELLVPEEKDVSLPERVRRANTWCAKLGSGNVCLVSIHLDAAGSGASWLAARGLSVRVSPQASLKSKELARLIYTEAESYGKAVTGNRATPKEKYWVQSLYMLNSSKCPAVLTENLFMDNREDVQWLMSSTGRETIIDIHIKGINNYIKKYN